MTNDALPDRITIFTQMGRKAFLLVFFAIIRHYSPLFATIRHEALSAFSHYGDIESKPCTRYNVSNDLSRGNVAYDKDLYF